jgi:putative FmdB family regulatory protein
MPIYDFYCPKCDVTKEHYVSNKEPFPICKECSAQLERLMPAPHFRFKDFQSVPNPNSFRSGYKQQPILPLNFIDVNQDGSYKITSTAKDPELLNG